MTVLIIIIHVLACIALIGIVLIQRGRGGGLVETFSSVESMFGPKTSAFLTKTTSILSVVFFLTCLSLAILSVRQSKSLMQGLRSPKSQKAESDTLKSELVTQQSDKTDTSKVATEAQKQ